MSKTGEMKRYCLRCPKFCFQFNADIFPMRNMWDRMIMRISNPFGLKGRLFCLCNYDYLEHVASTISVKAVLSWKDSDMLKGDDYFKFNADDVPRSLERTVMDFASEKPCLLQFHKKHCHYFMEREMEEWNGNGTEGYNPWE